MATALATTATVTTTKEIKLAPQLRRKLLTELRAYAELKEQAKAIEQAMKKHKQTLDELREKTGEKSVALEGFKITLVEPVRSYLDKEKLIEVGVTTAQIEEATIVKPGRPYAKVTVPGERESDDN